MRFPSGSRLGVAVSLFTSVLAAGPLAALDPERPIWRNVHDSWDVDDGLPQSSINALAQTADAYLWAGTYDGLARFDGFRFQVFRPSNTPGLRISGIRALLVDPSGRLWIGTGGGGLSVRDPDGTIRAVDGTDGWLIRTLAVDHEQNLWIGTSGRGLARLTPAGSLTHEEIAADVAGVNALWVDADGTLWLGTDGQGLWRRSARGSVERIDTGSATLVLALFRDDHGTLWIGTAGGGLWKLLPGADKPSPADSLGTRTITAFLEDRAGALWMATGGGGLLRRTVTRLERHDRGTGLAHDVLSALLEDREGALWVGMSAAGLWRLQGGSFSSFGASDGLGADVVYSVVEDGAGELWVASVTGELMRGRGGRFSAVPIAGLPAHTPLRSLALSTNDEVWVATYGRGVFHREAVGSWHNYTAADGLPNDNVRNILATRDGAIWVATIRGLGRFADGRWTQPVPVSELPTGSLISLAEAPDRTLWFGLDGAGLGSLEPGGARRFFTRRDGLASDVVLSLRVGDDGGSLWIGTNGGLSRLRDGRIESWTTRHGLPSDNVAQIAEDGHGHLWLGTAAGVARIPLAGLSAATPTLELRTFGRGAGLASTQLTAPSNGPLRARDGRLWFPTLAGLTVVDPADLGGADEPPVVHIEDLVADGQPLAAGPRVTLPLGTARLEVRYTGISTRAAQLVTFRYRLSGFDPDWVSARNRRTAHYTAIPPGAYTFEVIARNAEGAESSASFELVMPPRVWQTWWFRTLVALALVGSLGGGFWARTRALRRRQRELEATVALRTEELRTANSELAELSLRDPLTGLANRRRFEATLLEEWRRAMRGGTWLSLALVDVDSFKQYNDSLGHAAGDACLRRVASTVAAVSSRAGELVARWGGEELALLLPGSTPEDAGRLAEIVRSSVAELAEPHPTSAVAPHVTVSIGVASLRPPKDGDPQELFAIADAALYEAKRQGRDRVIAGGDRAH